MLTPNLVDLHSPMVNGDELPECPESCWILVMADIGAVGESGSDTFTFTITTIDFIAKMVDNEGYQMGHGLIILEKFDWDIIEFSIKKVIEDCKAETWGEVVVKIGKHAQYEFEDYQE